MWGRVVPSRQLEQRQVGSLRGAAGGEATGARDGEPAKGTLVCLSILTPWKHCHRRGTPSLSTFLSLQRIYCLYVMLILVRVCFPRVCMRLVSEVEKSEWHAVSVPVSLSPRSVGDHVRRRVQVDWESAVET